MNYKEYSLYLYDIFSSKDFPSEVLIPNDSWKDFINLTYKQYNKECTFKYCENLPIIDLEPNNKMIIGYSGGRDSLASYLKNRETFDIKFLFHCEGLNRSYRNETNVVKEVENEFNVPCCIYKFNNKAKDFIENPIKNFTIVGLIVDMMITNKITNCSMGMYEKDSISHVSGNDFYSDCVEPLRLFEKAIQSTFKNFKFIYAFEEQVDAVYYFLKNHRDKLEFLQSCMLPDRYRPSLSIRNAEKYHLKPMKNRCLCSCRKCIQELFQISILDNTEIDEELRKHCISFLRSDLEKVGTFYNLTKEDVKKMSEDELLNNYFNFKKFKELCL